MHSSSDGNYAAAFSQTTNDCPESGRKWPFNARERRGVKRKGVDELEAYGQLCPFVLESVKISSPPILGTDILSLSIQQLQQKK